MALIFFLFLLLPASLFAQTEVELGIKSSFASRIPLWMERFKYMDAGQRDRAEKLENIVLSDLDFSGVFEVNRGRPSSNPGDPASLEVLLRGVVMDEGRRSVFEGRVIDAASGRLIGGKRYELREGLIRSIAHHFTDEVVRLLTGEKGIASTKLLFVRRTGERWELVMSDYDGYGARPVLRVNRPILNPRWIDGREALAYTAYFKGKPDLYFRRLDEAVSHPIASYDGLNYSIDWSQKRGELLVTLSKDGNPEIYIMSRSGKIKKRLTYNRAIDCGPSWSPNGREIVFTSDRSGSPQLYLMEADGTNTRRLTFAGGYNASPAWSPRGDLIAFVSRIDGFFQLCTIRPDGSDMRVLTDERVNHDNPRWARDGRHITYTKGSGDESVISMIDIGTLGKRILSGGRTPDWSAE